MNKIIDIPIYNQDVMVHFGDIDELRESLKEYLDKEDLYGVLQLASECQCGMTIYNEAYSYIVVMMRDMPKSPGEFGTLIHELSHAVNHVMKKVGVKPSEESEESYTYLLGYLTKEVFEKFSLISCQSL